MQTINEGFGELGVKITNKQIIDIEKAVVHFALRTTHPLTLDGIALGLHPIAFIPSDYNALFDIFEVHQRDVVKVIRDTPSINKSWKVTSDPFNLLTFWIIHLSPTFIKNETVRHNFMMNVLRYYHYKVFASVVNHLFPHGANPGIMEAAIAELTKKSDIVRFESWRRLIDSHCERYLDPKGKIFKTIVDGYPDEDYLKVVARTQGELRQKLITFAGVYYDVHLKGDKIGSRSAVGTSEDGEKLIAQTASVIESAEVSMVDEVLNVNMFINEGFIEDIARPISSISSRFLKVALLKINETAIIQTSTKKFDYVTVKGDYTHYVGVRSLIGRIVRSMIRICQQRRINMSHHGTVFDEMRKVYSSSRSQDKDVMDIKRSVADLIDPFNITSNEASKASLRLAVIYYIVYRILEKMKL